MLSVRHGCKWHELAKEVLSDCWLDFDPEAKKLLLGN